MIETKDLIPLKTQLSKLENHANELTIATQEENATAIELKAKLRDMGKTIKDRKEEITKPLNTALKSARDLFAPLEKQFENAESIIGRKLISYKQKVEEDARKAAEKIADRVERGTMKMETAEKKIDNLPTTQKSIDTDHGRVQFRKIKKVRIINENLIPRQYLIPDMVTIRKDALAGVPIAGCEVYEEETV